MNPRTVHHLLDAGEAARLLAALPAARPVQGVTIESVWAKPGRHFNVCYRIDDGAAGRLASLCIVNESEAARAARRIERRAAHNAETGAGVSVLAAVDVLAQAFPFDYRLDHLGDCLSPGVVHDVLGDGDVDACEVAAYRPGMRCQLRYSAGGSARAYGKIAVERDPGRRRRVHRELCAATATTTLRLPALLGTVEALGLDVVAAAGGRSLHDTLADAPDAQPVAEVTRALAELHAGVPALPDRVHTANDEFALVESWTSWMRGIEPAMARPLARGFAALAAAMPRTVPTTFAHRDFYDRQVLLDGSRSWLLDVDTACTGDPELDLGNFLAHLFLRGLQWERVAAHRELEAAALDAYGSRARRDVTHWYRRASLLRLSCVYQLRPRWRPVVTALLDEAMLP